MTLIGKHIEKHTNIYGILATICIISTVYILSRSWRLKDIDIDEDDKPEKNNTNSEYYDIYSIIMR